MGIQDAVIQTPHPLRAPRLRDETRTVDEDKTSTEDKPQTRIPVSRFKPAVERVQRERRDSGDGSDQTRKREAPEKPRRTSIPKLRDRVPVARKLPITTDDVKNVNLEAKDETPVKTERKPRSDRIPVMRRDHNKHIKKDDVVKKSGNEVSTNGDQAPVNQEESVKIDSYEKLDDEFDKLYEEIAVIDVGSLPDEILEIKVKDPEKLESKFEEIVHRYDEETIEQVKIEPVDKARYSKIPLLRRRSSHDIKVPKLYERRLSLKTGIVNKIVKIDDEITNDNKVNIYDKKPNGVGDDDTLKPFEDSNENDQKDYVEINNNEDHCNAIQSPNPVPIYNAIPTPDAEVVKVGIFGISTREIPLENNNVYEDVATPEIETVKLAIVNISPKKTSEDDINNDIDTVVEAKPVNIHEDTIHDKLNSNPIETFKESKDVVDVVSNEGDDIDIENKIENDAKSQKETIKIATIKYDKVIRSEGNNNSPQEDILTHNPDDELKSVSLLKHTNFVEERTKSRYINKPVVKKIDNTNISTHKEEPTVRDKVRTILKRLSSHERIRNNLSNNNETEIKKEEISIEKEVTDMHKKKSVLSKIAMFERAEPEPPYPQKQIHNMYSKPKRTISQEMKHSPKIVQEVLKPKGAEQSDKHTIVSVDIIKPAEVVTNDEEQTVVENIKEHEIVLENLDEIKASQIELIENEPKELSIDHNEALLIDDNILNDEIKDADVTKEHAFANNVETIAPDLIELNNNILSGNHSRYKTSESRDDYLEDKDNKTRTEYKPKDHILHESPLIRTELNINRLYNQKDKVEKWKSTDALADYVPVKEKINRLTSFEDTKIKRAKSTAELDLGDAVKGKVKNIIVRMNSIEVLDDAKLKEAVINAKERPRKRSVSEKIALFERKLTPVSMENVKVDSGRALNIDAKPDKEAINAIHVESANEANDTNMDFAARIKELTNAKMTYGSFSNMSFIELRDGRKMPVLALGTALLDPRLAKYIVAAAIDLGFRAIDTAFIYGNEREVGEGIRAKIQDGTVKREDLFIISKLWSTFHRPDLVEAACRASLAATGLDYFDLYIIHNPMSFKEGGDALPKIANVLQFSSYDYLDAWFAMEALLAKGLARSIGVSNFNSVQLTRVLEKGRVKPVVNQVECHPYLSQQRLSDFCEARDVRLSCFGVLGSKGTPAAYKSSQAAAIDDPLVQVMAAGLGITPAQLLIRYQIDSGHGVVVKASTAAHLWDDLQALNTTLEPSQVAALRMLNKNKRAFTFKGMGDTHRNYPFKIPF